MPDNGSSSTSELQILHACASPTLGPAYFLRQLWNTPRSGLTDHGRIWGVVARHSYPFRLANVRERLESSHRLTPTPKMRSATATAKPGQDTLMLPGMMKVKTASAIAPTTRSRYRDIQRASCQTVYHAKGPNGSFPNVCPALTRSGKAIIEHT